MRFFITILVNFVVFGIVLYLLVWVAAFLLSGYTRHGQSLTLPNLKGLKVEDAESVLRQRKLRMVITDTVFMENIPKSALVDQNPAPNSKVKEGRIVYVTLNSDATASVLMPNLISSSARYAETVLMGIGLKIGNISFKPDIAQNNVLDQLWRGQSIQPNTRIPKGAVIDLIVGDGSGGSLVPMPNLTGLNLLDATNVLQSSLLQLGSVIYEGSVKDSARAIIRRQNPPYVAGQTLHGGEYIDVTLSAP